MKTVRNILITDVSHPVTASALGTLRSSLDYTYRIIGVDHSVAQYPVGKLWVDHHYIVPTPDNANDYVNAVLDICKKHAVNVIVPWTNDEAIALAKYTSSFLKHGIKLLTSSIDGINKVVDKHTLMNNLRRKGFATPVFFNVDTVPELRSAVKTLGYPKNKVVVKPRNLSGARGFCLLDPKSDISGRNLSDTLPFPAYLEVIKHLPVDKQANLDLLAMEFLAGEDYSVDVLAKNSTPIAIIPRLRLHAAGGVSSLGETVYNPEVSRIAANVVEAFGLNLNVNVQMRYREKQQGAPFVYDVNPRISGTIAANDHVGINLIHEGIQSLLDEQPTIPPSPTYGHTLMVRRWQEEYVDFEDKFPATIDRT